MSRFFFRFFLFFGILFYCEKKPKTFFHNEIEHIKLGHNIAASYNYKNEDIYAGDVESGYFYQSTDHGISWRKLYHFQNGAGPIRCVFVSHQGTIFVSRDRTGELLCSEDGGHTFVVCLNLSDQEASTVWHIVQNKKGWLFAGEYSNKRLDESCAFIYRSKDDGKNWEIVYNNPDNARHIHFVAADPYTNYLYAAMGDGDDRARLIRSEDEGNSWNTIGQNSLNPNIDWQFTSIVFTPHFRIFGEDDPIQSDIIRTKDDQHFERVFIPTGIEKHNFWSWGRIDSMGNICFGSWSQHLPLKKKRGKGVIYLSKDKGATWELVVDFGIYKNHSGTHFASNFLENDWLLCHSTIGSIKIRSY